MTEQIRNNAVHVMLIPINSFGKLQCPQFRRILWKCRLRSACTIPNAHGTGAGGFRSETRESGQMAQQKLEDNLRERRDPRRKRGIRWHRKVLYSLIVAIFFFGTTEFLLGLAGVRPVIDRRDSFVGFTGTIPLFVKSGDQYSTNPLKLSYFNQQSFAVKKPANGFRIFCLGGSTTFGHPYEDPTSFCGWLRELLKISDESRNWEVINCGGISYASYRVAVLMEELATYEPDLIIVYTGHNEFLEDRTYKALRTPGVLESLGRQVLKLRLSGLIEDVTGKKIADEKNQNRLAAEVDVILDHKDGPESYHRDDVHRQGVITHFRRSLERIVDLARGSDAQVILIEPESNLRDFSPFKSESAAITIAESVRQERLYRNSQSALNSDRLDEAAALLEEAVKIDPRNAAQLFRAATAMFKAGRMEDARRLFIAARDEDVCPLRAFSEITQSVRNVANSLEIPLVDFPKIVAQHCQVKAGNPLPGDECFLDHVHPTIELNGELALAILQRMQSMKFCSSIRSGEDMMEQVRDQVTGQLDRKEQSLALVRVAQVLAWAGKNAEGLRSARQAVEIFPENSAAVSQYGRMLEKTEQPEAAFEQYLSAVRLDPDDSLAQSRLAAAYFLKDAYSEAQTHWQQAVKTTPDSAPLSFRVELHMRLGDCHSLQGNRAAALQEYRIALSLDPTSAPVLERLSRF